MSTEFEIACQSFDRLVEPGTHLMVHSALGKMGGKKTQPIDFIQHMLDRLGPDGCLLMPAHSSTPPVESFVRSDPLFDPDTSPIYTGALPNIFKEHFNPIRSLHPWMSVLAQGQNAEYYVKDHHKGVLPVGKNSPYYRITQHPHGKILMLGISHYHNVGVHILENLLYPHYPYRIYENYLAAMRYRDYDGIIRQKYSVIPRRPPHPKFEEWGEYLEEKNPFLFTRITTPLDYPLILVDAGAYLEATLREYYENDGLCLYHPKFCDYPSTYDETVRKIKNFLGLPPKIPKEQQEFYGDTMYYRLEK